MRLEDFHRLLQNSTNMFLKQGDVALLVVVLGIQAIQAQLMPNSPNFPKGHSKWILPRPRDTAVPSDFVFDVTTTPNSPGFSVSAMYNALICLLPLLVSSYVTAQSW
jgi:hypothetical protein